MIEAIIQIIIVGRYLLIPLAAIVYFRGRNAK